MFVNTAGSIVAVKQGVDYTPQWINTSPILNDKVADAGNGPGYWQPPIGALHCVADPGGPLTFWTLKGNTYFRVYDLLTPRGLQGGSLTSGVYYYRLAIKEGTNYSFPSKVQMIDIRGVQKSIEVSWNRVVGAESYVLFRGTTYGSWDEMIELPITSLKLIDDGTASWVSNTVTDFGIPVSIPSGAFTVGQVYNIWFKKYTGGNDDAFLGYRPVSYPTDF